MVQTLFVLLASLLFSRDKSATVFIVPMHTGAALGAPKGQDIISYSRYFRLEINPSPSKVEKNCFRASLPRAHLQKPLSGPTGGGEVGHLHLEVGWNGTFRRRRQRLDLFQ